MTFSVLVLGTKAVTQAFEEMMTQVKEGNIQVIITKDYSRLGRDYLEVGRYLEFVFPVLKVRYISVMIIMTVIILQEQQEEWRLR